MENIGFLVLLTRRSTRERLENASAMVARMAKYRGPVQNESSTGSLIGGRFCETLLVLSPDQ